MKKGIEAEQNRYPKPGQTGGKIIRALLGSLRQGGIETPINSHILCATSGGSDSIALAHLLCNYGRRVGGSISLLHINHALRGDESQADEAFVQSFADQNRVPLEIIRLTPNTAPGASLEEWARTERLKIFRQKTAEENAFVFTAHHADDLAETLLWRLFTGSTDTHGAGILQQSGGIIRPFLKIRKADLLRYLEEEKQTYRNDSMNQNPTYLRNQIRQELMPQIEKTFPNAVNRLVETALKLQSPNAEPDSSATEKPPLMDLLFQAKGLKLRRRHWDLITNLEKSRNAAGEAHLPEGWVLKRRRSAPKLTFSKKPSSLEKNLGEEVEDQWILERR